MNAILPYTQPQVDKLVSLLKQRGVNPDRFQVVLESGLLSDIFEPTAALANRLAVRCALGLGAILLTSGSHIVDYDMGFEKMVAAGKYDWKNGNITAKRFPIVDKGKVEFEDAIFRFNHHVSSKEVVREILAIDPKNPWRPAKIENILVYAAKNTEERRKFAVVGLGSIAKVYGEREVLCLNGNLLDIGWWDSIWIAHNCCFLGVRRKISQISAS